MDEPRGSVLVRVTGWGDLGIDSGFDITSQEGLDADFVAFAVSHAKHLIGDDENQE